MIAGGLRNMGAKRNMNVEQFLAFAKLVAIESLGDLFIVTDQCNYFEKEL